MNQYFMNEMLSVAYAEEAATDTTTTTTGTVDSMSLLGGMGSGASSMFETIMVTILVSAMCGLIREYGGFAALLSFIRRVFKGRVGGRLGVGLLVVLFLISKFVMTTH